MPTHIELIQLETSDDVTSVRDRLSYLRGRNVLLIWPERGTTLTRKLDLVLLQREASRHAVRLALVTHDTAVSRSAIELGLSVFETIGSAQRAKWQRPRTRTFTTRAQRPLDQPDVQALAPIASRLRPPAVDLSPAQRRVRLAARLTALIVFVTVIAAVAFVALPSATVIIIPSQNQAEITASITADPNIGQDQIDVENGIVPALTLRAEIEERASIATTGVRSFGATPALGSVVFINTTSSPVDIPLGTFVSTSAGTPIIFRTTQAAVVTGGEGLQIEVPIEAVPESAGEVGNDIQVGLINTIIGNLADQLQVRNLAPTYGGTSQQIRVVTQDDRTRLNDILRQQIQQRAYSEMLPRIGEDQFLIPESIRITEERDDWTIYDQEVGQESDAVSLTMRAVVEATAVDMRIAEQLAYVRLSNQIPRGRSIDLESLIYQRAADVAIDAEGRASFTLTARGDITVLIDVVQLQQRLAGLSLSDAQRYLTSTLALAENTQPQIELSPDWFGRMPLLPSRIVVLRGNL